MVASGARSVVTRAPQLRPLWWPTSSTCRAVLSSPSKPTWPLVAGDCHASASMRWIWCVSVPRYYCVLVTCRPVHHHHIRHRTSTRHKLPVASVESSLHPSRTHSLNQVICPSLCRRHTLRLSTCAHRPSVLRAIWLARGHFKEVIFLAMSVILVLRISLFLIQCAVSQLGKIKVLHKLIFGSYWSTFLKVSLSKILW